MQPITLPDVPNEQNFYAIDPLDGRYFDPEVAKYLSESSRIAYQAYMEAALAQTLAENGICTPEIANAIDQAAANVKAEDVYKEEQTTKHDVKALVNCIKAGVNDEAKPFVHFGATSYDIVASASALQLRDTTQNIVIPRLKTLVGTLIGLATEHAETTQIGRTHGQHAVPITFGFAIAEYVERLGTSARSLEVLSGKLTGKFSGAVGAYNALSLFVPDPVAFEKAVLAKVGLEPAGYSTQIVPADSTARLMAELTVASGVMANLANDMRHLQRSEIAEVHEKFEAGQTGSSTMAHKKNPINFENVVSLSKQVLAQSVNVNQNLSSEHQRDLTDSASARFYTISFACVASMAKRLNDAMSKLEVDAEAMQRNLKLSGGAIAAEPLYLLLEKHGHTTAHEKSKALSHQALESNKPLVGIIATDQEVAEYWQKFTPEEQKIIQNPEKYYTGLAAQKTRQIIEKWKT